MTKTMRVPPPGAIPLVPCISLEKRNRVWILKSAGISAGDGILTDVAVDF